MADSKNTIVIIARKEVWEQALLVGEYKQSTIDSVLEDVGFIHCSTPDQTLEIANRRYSDQANLILLYIDTEKVKSPIKFEGALSGRSGIFPHIYGPLNVDAVYDTKRIIKDTSGNFVQR